MSDISIYTDPGTYIQEEIAQGSVTLGVVPLAVTLIGIAATNRTFTNEAIVRGQVSQTLTVAGSSPHTATLSPASNQSVSSTEVFVNGIALPLAGFSYVSPTQIRIADQYYKAGSTYTINYIAPSSEMDSLANSDVVQIDKVGSFPSVTSFMLGVDYQLTSNKVDWSILMVASLTGTTNAPFDLSVNYNITFSLDGLPALTVNCQGATPSATTAAEVVSALNTALIGSSFYGVPYTNAASVVSSTKVNLSGIVPGKTGSVTIYEAATLDASLTIFGIALIALPLTVYGVGQEPALGSTYYVTYETTRPATDYNTSMQFFSPASAYAIIGNIDIFNPLAQYVDICFTNGAPSVFCIIANSTSDADMITALGASETNSGCTEILPISTSLNVQVATLESVTNMSSQLNSKPRRGWYGMARNTAIGDQDTPGTLVYLSAVTLQVPGDSPGRGRSILTAPSECARTFTFPDGTTLDITLDGTALAAATASVLTSFTNASVALDQKTLAGFDQITILTDAQRHQLAQNGVNVVSYVGGNLVLRDPVTTEVAGGGLLEFVIPSVGVQKDKVATLIIQEVNANLLGIVPEDLSDFLNDIKEVVGNELKALVDSGDIGPYTNADGTRRDLNFQTDIQAFQSATDKTQYGFRYYFNGRYPAKRFFGQFSVDNPFFSPSQGS